ncbi:hypothetical protein [Edaphobacter aggregans]|uniref:hypothetical protein n=1 Tax=Edaphobacter aggregans TaxID=570835 RepID=UPI00068DA086|nr:hypothetical protein [Edaphobacter aggregans]
MANDISRPDWSASSDSLGHRDFESLLHSRKANWFQPDDIGGVSQFHPTDPQILANYEAVLAAAKPHQKYLCDQLGIRPEEYTAWLAALFMTLFRPAPNEPNIMECIIKGIFELPSGYPMVCVHRYDSKDADKRCLLSDRGYSIPLGQPQHLSFSFNLCSNAFIIYVFASIDALDLTK